MLVPSKMNCGEYYAERRVWKEILTMLEHVPTGLTAHQLDALLSNPEDIEVKCDDTTWTNNKVRESKLYHVIRNQLQILQKYNRITASVGDGDYVYRVVG